MTMKVLTKKRLALLVVALTASAVVLIVKLSEVPQMVKEGKIEDIEHHTWEYSNTPTPEVPDLFYGHYGIPVDPDQLSKPSDTVLYFEDGEVLVFASTVGNVEIGKKYRIVYHEGYAFARGNFYWSGNYYVIESIEQ